MPTPKKAYCFTLNNYSEDEFTEICGNLANLATYAIIAKEIGELGTPHLQGYCIFTRPYRFSTIKNRYLPRCHIEVAAGSPRANREYCSKDGEYREFGQIPTTREGNSSRDELATEFVTCMERGRSGLSDFVDANPGTWMYSGHTLLRNYLAIQPLLSRDNIQVYWYWGLPGVGKSRRAHQEMPEAYIKDPRTKWWNGYLLEKECIIDDYGPGGIDINHLLRWFDRYKCYVESKGGMLPLHVSKFIVTSNFKPCEIFKWGDYINPQLPALERRLNIIEIK